MYPSAPLVTFEVASVCLHVDISTIHVSAVRCRFRHLSDVTSLLVQFCSAGCFNKQDGDHFQYKNLFFSPPTQERKRTKYEK